MVLVHAVGYASPLFFVKAQQLGGVLLWGIQISPVLVLEKVGDSSTVPFLLGVSQHRSCFFRSAVEGVPLLVKVVEGIPLLVIVLVGLHLGQNSSRFVRLPLLLRTRSFLSYDVL